jgi:hypothetical protein
MKFGGGVFLRVVSWWAAILVLAILNGALREELLIPAVGNFFAQLASGLILSLIIFVVAYMAIPGFGHLAGTGYWFIGSVWTVMTLIFEFGFGLFVQQKELSELLQGYTFKGGNIWPVALLSTFASPRAMARLRRVLKADGPDGPRP